MNITFNNSPIINSQMGNSNVMNNVSNMVLSENEWKILESGLEEALHNKNLREKQKELLEETKKKVRRRDTEELRQFIKANGANLFTGACANVLSSGIIGLLAKLL